METVRGPLVPQGELSHGDSPPFSRFRYEPRTEKPRLQLGGVRFAW